MTLRGHVVYWFLEFRFVCFVIFLSLYVSWATRIQLPFTYPFLALTCWYVRELWLYQQYELEIRAAQAVPLPVPSAVMRERRARGPRYRIWSSVDEHRAFASWGFSASGPRQAPRMFAGRDPDHGLITMDRSVPEDPPGVFGNQLCLLVWLRHAMIEWAQFPEAGPLLDQPYLPPSFIWQGPQFTRTEALYLNLDGSHIPWSRSYPELELLRRASPTAIRSRRRTNSLPSPF